PVTRSPLRRIQFSLAAGAIAVALVVTKAPLGAAAVPFEIAEAAQQTPQPQVPFRAGVDVVSLNVTVTDGTTRYVTDLAQDDFNVFEDGVKQDVTFFTRTNLPIAL